MMESNSDNDYIIYSQKKLVWNRFKQHKIAYISLIFLIFLYIIAIFADFIAPYDPNRQFNKNLYSPPHSIQLFHKEWIRFPFIYGYKNKINKNFKRIYIKNLNEKINIKLFVKSDHYKLLGFIETNIHLFGTGDFKKPIFL